MAALASFARVGGKRTSLGKRIEACVGQVAGPKDPHQWIVCACGRISAATTVCGLRVNAWWNSDDDAPKPVRSSSWGARSRVQSASKTGRRLSIHSTGTTVALPSGDAAEQR